MSNLRATLLALAVAVAFFAFAMQWRGMIIFAAVCAGLWLATRYLRRRFPLFNIFCIEFIAGFFNRKSR